jgi:hypothetical protein
MYGTSMLLTGRTDMTKGVVLGLGLTDKNVGLLSGVDCDILTQDLIGLIEYLYHQGVSSFP